MKINELNQPQQCPECGGPAFTSLMLAEKQDACYHKVRSRYKVWPSAYASGALVQCRKKGAANWGNKSKNEDVAEGQALPYLLTDQGNLVGRYSTIDKALAKARKTFRQKAAYGPTAQWGEPENLKIYQGAKWSVDGQYPADALVVEFGADRQPIFVKQQGMAEASFDYTMKDMGDDYAGFASNHSMKHKMLKRIKPEKQQLYKDKINNTRDWDSLFALFKVAKERGDIIEQGIAEAGFTKTPSGDYINQHTGVRSSKPPVKKKRGEKTGAEWDAIEKAKKDKEQGVAEGLPQTLRKVVPGYAKREIDKKMDAGKFGKTDADKDANFQRYKKIQDKIKEQGVAEDTETYKQGHAKFHTKTNKQIGPTHYGRGSDKKADSYTKADPRYHEVRPVKEQGMAEAANPAQQAAIAINMKKTGNKPMNEYNAEYDDEAGMADNNLETLKRAVEGIDDLIQTGDNLPEWCQEKIANAKSMLVAVWDYMYSEEASDEVDPEIDAMFEAMDQMIEAMAVGFGTSKDTLWEQFESLDDQTLYETASYQLKQLNEDWQKVNKRDRTAGMSRKAVKAYRRENPGSKLQTAVTTKPSKLKKGSKAAKRRKSFCARMRGMKKSRASAKTKRNPNSPINKALRRWNC